MIERFKGNLISVLNHTDRGVNIAPDVNKDKVTYKLGEVIAKMDNKDQLRNTIKEIMELAEEHLIKPQ